jgi:hypothetical protein
MLGAGKLLAMEKDIGGLGHITVSEVFLRFNNCSIVLQFHAPFLPLVGSIVVANLTWPSVGVKPNTWKSWGFGVVRDSRMFRAQQQGAKHLALGCSWCHWKGLET